MFPTSLQSVHTGQTFRRTKEQSVIEQNSLKVCFCFYICFLRNKINIIYFYSNISRRLSQTTIKNLQIQI